MEVLTKENEGHGATLLFGYRYAMEHGADYIFQTDSDGQTRPEEFPAFWKSRAAYDMIIGYRNKRQDGWMRILVTKVLNWLYVSVSVFRCFGAGCQYAVPSDEYKGIERRDTIYSGWI